MLKIPFFFASIATCSKGVTLRSGFAGVSISTALTSGVIADSNAFKSRVSTIL